MKLVQIRERVKKRNPDFIGIEKRSAVFLPLISGHERSNQDNNIDILFQVRSKSLDIQPGEISLPGGKKEVNETYKQTAIRETKEELGVTDSNIQLYGPMDALITPYNLMIVPYIGELVGVNPAQLNINKAEVNHIFTVPVDFFVQNPPREYTMTVLPHPEGDFPFHLVPYGEEYPFRKGKYPSYFYTYKRYTIWGFTARIVKHFIETIYV